MTADARSSSQAVSLTAAEVRGFNVFTDPNRGNCFACHYSGPTVGGGEFLFTDFTHQARGVPRNSSIPADATRPGLPVTYYDLGLCTAQNPAYPHSVPASAEYCGMFKVPTLRNVATRKVLFRNGVFKALTDVLNWYNTRDTNPGAWYPTVNGIVQKFNDLPPAYRLNIDTVDVPLGVHGQPVEHGEDFCVARLSLDKVVGLSRLHAVHGHEETVAAYTYRIKPAKWLADPQARQVFPIVDRIIRGEGRLEMTATLEWRGGKWAPVLPGQ
ncbi:MAG TPA: hypothetical protein VHV80_09570 [Steroidobacteraceae bacterium]|jgi:hypothetical protein|nr:hypothetical protein [Steroidobacteraceae bacterium]